VRAVVRAQASYPSSEESDLILWRSEHEQADRPEIVRAMASFAEGLKQLRSEGDADAYNIRMSRMIVSIARSRRRSQVKSPKPGGRESAGHLRWFVTSIETKDPPSGGGAIPTGEVPLAIRACGSVR
jgi:hypothetical protein